MTSETTTGAGTVRNGEGSVSSSYATSDAQSEADATHGSHRILELWAEYADLDRSDPVTAKRAKDTLGEMGLGALAALDPEPDDVENRPEVIAALRATTVESLSTIEDPRKRARMASAVLRRLEIDGEDIRKLRDLAVGEMKANGSRNAEIARVTGLSTARIAQLEVVQRAPARNAVPTSVAV